MKTGDLLRFAYYMYFVYGFISCRKILGALKWVYALKAAANGSWKMTLPMSTYGGKVERYLPGFTGSYHTR